MPGKRAGKPKPKPKAPARPRTPAAKGRKPAKAAKRPASAPKAVRKARAKPPAEPSAEPPAHFPLHEAPPPPPEPGWLPVDESTAAAWPAPTVPASPPTSSPPRPAFDPSTGEWLPVASAAPAAAAAVPAAPAPEAPRRDAVATVWHVILALDLLALGVNFLAMLAIGAVLIFAPDSAEADEIRATFEGSGGSQVWLVLETLITLVMMGVIPFLWVLFTRRGGWEGARRYLYLHSPARSVLVGAGLAILLVVAVIVLSVLYILITEGPDALSLVEEDEGENPAVEALLEGLTWPVAILVALVAGVGEEILFRGVLFRQLGLWPQAVLFGLAHAAGGYLPQIIFAFCLALFFAYLLRRGVSMLALMTAHFLYDLTLLSLSILYS